MSKEFDHDKLFKEYRDRLGPMPERPPLNIKIIYKRKMCRYEEWKIEYTAEGPDTMPEPSGQKIPAYLLIPATYDDCKAPFPAMVCYHQCFCDCDIGKEAVVGKMVQRPDQAYGLELVQQGFVVIAPDTWGCGERNIPSVRKEGERTTNCSHPVSLISYYKKIILEGICAVDVLQSLDCVDGTRIGAIGHSMGAHTTFIHMAYDQRIKGGIVSGFGDYQVHGLFKDYNEGLAFLCPRLFMQFQGSYDGTQEQIQKLINAHKFAGRFYEKMNVADNLVLRIKPCHHVFIDEFKWEAYARLKEYFGIAEQTKHFFLEEVLQDAKKDLWCWEEDDKKAFLNTSGKHSILGKRRILTDAFRAMFIILLQKRPAGGSLSVAVESDQDRCYVVCTVLGTCEGVKSAHEYLVRSMEQGFFENSAFLRRENTPDQVKYVVTLQKAK
ncbi:MAG: acetylxylan esterase [Candidatus Edwardsbacteria bacterium]